MIDSLRVGPSHWDADDPSAPFTVGNLDPDRGFVHVFDDANFEILLGTVDTVDDFTKYLERKEALMTGPVAVWAASEEDLLAYYLKGINKSGEHSFRVPPRINRLAIPEGVWADFAKHPERLAQIDANDVSYAWDRLIDRFVTHQLAGTAYFDSGVDLERMETALRVMAAEPRTRRRLLAKALIEAIRLGDGNDRLLRFSPGVPNEPAYAFLTLKKPANVSYEKYRITRLRMLQSACVVARVFKAAEASCVVGIATEPAGRADDARSEDFVYVGGPISEEQRRIAGEEQVRFGFFADPSILKTSHRREHEYPLASVRDLGKGRRRNEVCPCGSGKKVKHCCGDKRRGVT